MKQLTKNWILKFKDIHFLIVLIAINLLQIYSSDLTSDEGYYWFYSLNMDWGFYDHPPLVALLVKMGDFLFHNEFGVRFFNTLLMSVGVFFLLRTIQTEKRWIIYLLLLSLPAFNYLSILVFPDTALVALSGIALFAYKKFLEKSDFSSSLLLVACFTLMLYAKYHAILFILFIVLSNFELLKNKYFYFIAGSVVILFLPHIFWQYKHDFVSVIYHLSGRASGFKLDYLIDYIGQQILMVGIGFIFVPFVYKAKNQFEKSLVYICLGTFLFFTLSSFRDYVHFHWTSIAIFPLIILAVKFYEQKKAKFVLAMMLPFFFFILIGRLQMAYMIFPVNNFNVDYFHNRSLWAEDLSKIAGNRVVVYETGGGGLREASLYQFYSGNWSVALFPGEYKKSQYQILNLEDSLQHKNVILLREQKFHEGETTMSRMGKEIHYKFVDDFSSYHNLKVEFDLDKITRNGTLISIPTSIYNSRKYNIHFKKNERLFLSLKMKNGEEKCFFDEILFDKKIGSNSKIDVQMTFDSKELPQGDCDAIIGIDDRITSVSYNSKRKKLKL